MPVVYILELCNSFYQRKTNCSYSFTDKKILLQVLGILLEAHEGFNYRVCSIPLEENECLDLQDMANDNTLSMEKINQEKRDITIDDIKRYLLFGHD